jgi:CBS domain-containing protein
MIIVRDDKPQGYIDLEALKNKGIGLKDAVIAYPVLVNLNDDLREVMSKMLIHDIRQFPVVDDNGSIVGTISYGDIRKCILKIFQDYKDETGS